MHVPMRIPFVGSYSASTPLRGPVKPDGDITVIASPVMTPPSGWRNSNLWSYDRSFGTMSRDRPLFPGSDPVRASSANTSARPANVAHAFAPGSRALVVSDGLIEQTGRDAMKDEEFGFGRVKGILRSVPDAEDELAALFDAVDRHAGAPLADDATALLVRCV